MSVSPFRIFNVCEKDPSIPVASAELMIDELPRVDGGFKTILADPPWRFANRTGKVAPEHKRLDRYGTMSLDEIRALPVKEVSAPNAHLYLWVPNALLPEGLKVMEDWGFRYVSNIVWAKRRKDGGPDGRGVGFYFRNVTEILLFGVKGSMRTLQPGRSQVNMIESRKREHSRKPDEQYPLIESCSPGPRLELFARYARADWATWGNEAEDSIVPRGKAHRGYTGGPIEVPHLTPHERLSDIESRELGATLARRYEQGLSLRDLELESGFSHKRIRTLLELHGVALRPRGRPASAPVERPDREAS